MHVTSGMGGAAAARVALLFLGLLFAASQLSGQNLSVKEYIYVDGRVIATERASSAAAFGKPGDYDGDVKADLTVFRPSTGTWHIRISSSPSNPISQQWGTSTDVCVPADYDGDFKSDIAVYRKSTGQWWIRPSGTPGSYTTETWGASTDFALPRDYDGDGKADLAVWRPSSGVWYIKQSGGSPGSYTARQWGMAGDIPISSLTNVLKAMP